MQRTERAQQTMLRLEGRRILHPDNTVCVELGDDDVWRTPEGIPTTTLSIATPRIDPVVDPEVRSQIQREADHAWLAMAVEAIKTLSVHTAEMTSDDVWAAVAMPPREPRMIGNAMARAQRAGHIAPTKRDTPSTRPINHGRPVRIWQSLRFGQQELDTTTTRHEEGRQ